MSSRGTAVEDVRHFKRDIGDAAFAGERARIRQGRLAAVDANHLSGRHDPGEINGNRAGPAAAVDEAHPGLQMRC